MSLLFIHLVERDYPAFDRELQRDPEEIADCYNRIIDARSQELTKLFEEYVSQSTGRQFSIINIIKRGMDTAVAEQHPHAQPGDIVTLVLSDDLRMDVIVGENQTFGGQTIAQMAQNLNVPEAEIEDFAFKQQIDKVGTTKPAEYLDITEGFYHPLAEAKNDGFQLRLNLHATASMILNASYLQPAETEDGGATARSNLANLLGDDLTPALEQQLRDRHLSTIYQVCIQIVDKLTASIER